jgi:putative spermidine/putrescine transport system substrate-binding protein
MNAGLSASLRWLSVFILAGVALAAAAATVLAQAPSRPKLEAEVVFAGYGGTFEKMTRQELIPPFEKATGIKVTLVVGTALSNFSKVQAARTRPDIDIYWSNELTHAAGKGLGLYEKLDPKVATNLAQVYDIARDPDSIGVVSSLLATGIHYNTKKLQEAGIPAPTSWNDLWNPRLKGKLALYTFGVAYSQDFLALMAKLHGGSEDNIQPGLARIKQLRANGNLVAFASTPAELDNLLVQGTAWMTVNGSPRAYILQGQGAPIDFAYPKEGAGFFANYFDIIKNAPHPNAAQAFVNYLIGVEAQAILSKAFYGPINRNVRLPDEIARKVPYGAERINSLVRIDRYKMNQYLDAWTDAWNREIEAK